MISPIRFEEDELQLLDQRVLPQEESWISYRDVNAVAAAIADMVVRGAPAIGVTAGYGMALAGLAAQSETPDRYRAQLAAAAETLRAARPTAVNLAWAVKRVLGVATLALDEGQSPVEATRHVVAAAKTLQEEDVATNRKIGREGSMLIPDGARILTHCNAGGLATAGFGTALGVVRAAVEDGKQVSVLAGETRPFLQGARLTAWELQQDGIPVELITDSTAGALMARGEVDVVVVGADRIARNGDVANKIGTYTAAVLARRHGVPFYVAAPVSTIDEDTPSGDEIPIEERDPEEVVCIEGRRIAPEGVSARHIAFDITPAALVTAIITEEGIARAPYDASIGKALGLEPEIVEEPIASVELDQDLDSELGDELGDELDAEPTVEHPVAADNEGQQRSPVSEPFEPQVKDERAADAGSQGDGERL